MNFTTTIDSPVGTLVLVSNGTALVALLFGDGTDAERLAGPCVADAAAAPFPQARAGCGNAPETGRDPPRTPRRFSCAGGSGLTL
jgi:hypothetical protein